MAKHLRGSAYEARRSLCVWPVRMLIVLLLAAGASAEVTRFAVIGDFGGASTGTHNMNNEAAVAALVHSWNPEFIITAGDNNYEYGEAATIDFNIGQFYSDFIGNYQGIYGPGSPDVNRFFPSLGNHDYIADPNAQPYLDYFTLPGNERYYDFTWGPIHFFAVNSDGHEPDGSTAASIQGQWLQAQMAASTSPWKVVYFHHPAYSSGQHGSTTKMRWPFEQWGADLVLAGHNHDYERLIVGDLTYIVNGLGGKGGVDYPGDPLPETVVRFRRYNDSRNYPSLFPSDYPGAPAVGYGAQLFEVTDTELNGWFITANGTVIDHFTLYVGQSPGNGGNGGNGGEAQPGQLRITEIMADPNSLNEWEWVEIANVTADTFDLTGMTLVDEGGNVGTLGPGSIGPGGVAVLIRSDGSGGRTLEGYRTAWGSDINFITVSNWPGLANVGETIELRDQDGTTLTLVDYGASGFPAGNDSSSIYLIDVNADPTDPTHWLLSVAGVAGAYAAADPRSSDVGSPGYVPGLFVPVLGDFNRDGALTNTDIQAMLDALMDLEGYRTAHGLSEAQLAAIGDINGSGSVTNTDIQALLDLLTGGSQSVPEPATLGFMGLLLAATAMRRHARYVG